MIFNIGKKRIRTKSDEEILGEFRSTGDPGVLGDLYSEYMHLVYGLCMKYLKNSDESQDAVMQIFEKILTEIPKHKIENFRNWLYVVSRNYCLMQLRSAKVQDEKMKEWMIDQAVFMEYDPVLHPIDEDDPGHGNGLIECIEKLRTEQKECIKQFYFSNRCYNEIAAEMKTDEKKVKSCLQNAKRNLKICLEGKDDRQK